MDKVRDIVDGLVSIASDSFFRKEGEDRYNVTFCSVHCWALNALYLRFTSRKEIEPIENIPQRKKEEYWRLSGKFTGNSAKHERVQVAKAIYILSLITSTD